MRERVIILLFCVIINKVTAPAPFSLPKTNLPQPKTTTPSTTTTKLPKWNDHVTKNSATKPVKDNAYLATLVNMPPKDKTKHNIDKSKTDGYNTKIENNEKECLNTTKILYTEEIAIGLAGNNSKENEISTAIGLAGNGSKNKEIATEIKKEHSKSKLNNTEPKKGVKLQELLKPLLAKSKTNNTDVQPKSFELPPTMIPIFRPKPNLTKNLASKDNLDTILITSEEPIISPVKETPALVENTITSKESQPNLNPNSNAIPFNIPCHRASDILDETPVISEKPRTAQANFETIAKAESPNSQEPNQVERPQKLDTDESLAIIFKPKNISLLNVYGDMLKKITLTVLVPYHMSKLGT